MTIRITYPNEGIYSNDQPRLEVVNKDNVITYSRMATDQEALTYGLIESLDCLNSNITELQIQLRNR